MQVLVLLLRTECACRAGLQPSPGGGGGMWLQGAPSLIPDGWRGPVVGSEKMQEGRQREKLVRV